MSNPSVPQKAPYVKGTAPGVYFWCACGSSKNQPYCDGSHKGTGFAPIRVELAETKIVAWCGCKHTKNGAFCDGSHARL